MTLPIDQPEVETAAPQTAAPEVAAEAAADVAGDVQPDITNAAEVVEVQEIAAELDALRAMAGQGDSASRIDVLRTIRAKLQAASDTLTQREREVSELRQQVSDLGPLAEDGRAYRQDLIEETISEGARAIGDTFPEPVYRNMLAQATIEEIKQVRQSFVQKSATVFPGGRQTIANAQPNLGKTVKTGRKPTPAEAYTV